MRMYMVGKVTNTYWRHDIVTGLRDAQYDHSFGDVSSIEDVEWPIMKKAILHRFDYTGPYMMSCDHSCYHREGKHAWAENLSEACALDGLYADGQRRVQSLCFEGIRRADIIFAWLEHDQAYGSLVEMGYAKALGKDIWIAAPVRKEDFWFVYEMANLLTFKSTTAKSALKRLVQAYDIIQSDAWTEAREETAKRLPRALEV